MRGRGREKGMTSPPVERGDNCECLEMLRWTEAISSTTTAPATRPAPSAFTDRLSIVGIRTRFDACVSARTLRVYHFCLRPQQPGKQQIPACLHCTTIIHAHFHSFCWEFWKELFLHLWFFLLLETLFYYLYWKLHVPSACNKQPVW